MRTYSPAELVDEMIAASRALDESLRELDKCVHDEAEAERNYRVARSTAYLGTEGTVGERDAKTTKVTIDEQYRAHLAEGLTKSALEAVRSRRAQLSSWQSVANSVREEAALARTGSGMTP